ncbi:MAG TPA: ABC transporter permease, partial [Acidobacteriaceae bacterium]|nr:ABC transporter permease [Acidobacteriaceae bacterium]
MHGLLSELRFTLRQLRRSPAFSAAALFTLALCIGANVVIFSIVRNVLLRPPDYARPQQLVVVRENVQSGQSGDMDLPVNANHLLYWRQHANSFQGFAALGFGSMPLGGGGRPENIGIAQHTANFFSLLGVQPILGRTLLPLEEQPGHNVVILTEGLWRRRFAADPGVIGRAIPLDGRPYTVIGVLPASFVLPAPGLMNTMHGTGGGAVEAFVPFGWRADQLAEIEGDHNYFGIGRLRPDVSIAQAAAEMNTMQQAIARQTPDHVALSATVIGLQPYLTAGSRSALLMLFAAIGTVLLIGCVNITNLLLARAAAREHEAAVRSAMGASAAQLVRSAVAEPLLLCAAGCALGLAGAGLALPYLAHALPSALPLLHPLRMDASLVLFAVAAAFVSALLCGLLPALRFVRHHPQQALRSESRTASESAGGKRLRRSLVVAEVAASVTLVVLAGVFLLSLYRLLRVDRGFATEHVVSADVVLPDKQYNTPAAREAFYQRSLEHLRQLPGVRSAGVISVLPLDGDRWGDMISVPGDTRPLWSRPYSKYRWTSAGFFETMRIPLLAGRFFADDDLGKRVAIVSQRAVETAWHGQSPIGQFFHRGDPDEPPFQVIGVVGDVRAVDLSEQPSAMVYVPLTYRSNESGSFVIRTANDPAAISDAVRKAIWSVDSQAVVPEVRTMDAVVDDSLAPRNFQLHLLLAFAACALVLAALGIYGVVAYSAMQRTRELGIRIALGAQPAQIYRLILEDGITPVLLGTLTGIALALLAARAVSGLLFGVAGFNIGIALGAAAILLLTGGLASLLPAIRATHIDP